MAVPVRRVVTGYRGDGKSGVVSDCAAKHVVPLDPSASTTRTDIWATHAMPVRILDEEDPTASWPDARFDPLPHGTSFFVMEIPPDHSGSSAELHKTPTLDYVIVLKGEIWAVFEGEDVLLKTGDILVQRGVPHRWSNRSDTSCLFAAVMLDARVPAQAQAS